MTLNTVIWVAEWIFLVYFISLNSIYLLLNFTSLVSIRRYMKMARFIDFGDSLDELMPPITVVVPARNEERHIIDTVKSIQNLDYPEVQIVVVNDGSTDYTQQSLTEAFDLVPTDEIYRDKIKTAPVESILRSRDNTNIHVINKENGGKADALNAGINYCKTPLVCCIDGDSILEEASLKTLVRPFLYDKRTVAAGGTVRVANGCEIKNGLMEKARLPDTILPLFQVVEYLRAFLFGRLGWEPFNGVMIISGAFGLYRRDTVAEVGGYQPGNIAEDMELVMRIHRHLSDKDEEYRIRYVPDPVCWTEVPADLDSLRNQRIRWQHGLMQSVMQNFSLFFKPGSGFAGWFAFPYQVLFEGFGAIVEALGYLFVAVGLLLGFISYPYAAAFFLVAIGFGIFVSIISFLIESISFNIYDDEGDLARMFQTAVLENFGYRQLNSFWRLIGIGRYFLTDSANWGTIERKGFNRHIENEETTDK